MSVSCGFDSSVLLGFYQSQLHLQSVRYRCRQRPARNRPPADQQGRHRQRTIRPGTRPTPTMPRRTPRFCPPPISSTRPMCRCRAGATTDAKMEQDNQKLFSLYSAVNTLAYLAKMAQSPTATSGQLAGLNDRFQTGLSAGPAISRLHRLQQFQSAGGQAVRHRHARRATIAFSDFTYATKQLVTNANLGNAAAGPFGLRQLHHRDQERRHHHQCRDRSVARCRAR